MKNRIRLIAWLQTTALVSSLLLTPAALRAAPLDEVVVRQQGEWVMATIKLTTPVHFLRFAPIKNGRIAEIFYDRMPSSDTSDPWQDGEELRSSASNLIPSFTVTARDQALRPKLVLEFASAVEFKINVGVDNRSFVVVIKPKKSADANAPKLPLSPTVLPPSSNANAALNQQAYRLMLEGRDALAANHYAAATSAFNQLLSLPNNLYSQDAQEWIGVTRERSGQPAKARGEYELYLKLYQSSQGAQNVKQRLAKLASVSSNPASTTTSAPRKVEPRSSVQGSISSHYYAGQTDLQVSYPVNGVMQTNNYSIKDQAALISTVDINGRFVNENYDNRLVFRDAATQNFIPGQLSKNRLNAAYFEIKNRSADFSARMGRQTPTGGGVMGRFDGVAAGYGPAQEFRMNVVAGRLVDFSSYSQPNFYGVSFDIGWFSLYFINQSLDGLQDRRAVGTELKYFSTGTTLYSMLDYDVYFDTMNAATFNGTFSSESSGTTLNLMGDYRKSPYISIRNALNGASTTSVQDLLATMTELELRQLARDRTGNMQLAQIGLTQKLDNNWQLGGDMKFSQVSGMPASGLAPDPVTGLISTQGYLVATPDSGLEKTFTAQLIGSNLYSDADITSLGSSVMSSNYVQRGQSVFVYNRSTWSRELALDSSWNFYQQADNYGGNMTRNLAMLRIAYQLQRTLTLDIELGGELTVSRAVDQSTTSLRRFGSLGLHWDF